MADIQNVFRRGTAYWWRRSLGWRMAGVGPVTLSFSLWTKDVSIARHRAASMTAQSEVVRMSIYERMERDGLKRDEVEAVMPSEMMDCRQLLRHEADVWRNIVRASVRRQHQ